MKLLLTIGIPTYNRTDHLNARLLDLEKLGYFNHPEVQIIIHDNDSTNKEHCLTIRNILKRVTNLQLIESSPNIGMVRGCLKIISNAKGDWITLLGDDDPIVMKCSHFLNLIKKNNRSDHLYFRTKIHKKGKISHVTWFPKLKIGNYKTGTLCAKTGFTTHFAFLGSHCFRNKEKMAEIWIKSHQRCMFYGHCVMLLENYQRSFYSGETVAAWNEGNERISYQLNLMRHLELRNLFKYPPTMAMQRFVLLKPREVTKKGAFSLLNHITHPLLNSFNKYERLPPKFRITVGKVRTLLFDPMSNILIMGNKKNKKENYSCIFISEKLPKKELRYDAAISFRVGPSVSTLDIIRIIGKLGLMGPIFLNDQQVDDLYLLEEGYEPGANPILRKIKVYTVLLYSIFLYGPEALNQRKIIINYFVRPRKGLYRIVNAFEKGIRVTLKKVLTIKKYYQIKRNLFGVEHFASKTRKIQKISSLTPKSAGLVR
jgi:Glycosyl transferase family 2